MRINSIFNDDGFSLIEIFIALGIFAVGSLAVLALYFSTNSSLRHSNELTEATFIAEEYLAETLVLKYKGVNAMKSDETIAGGDVLDRENSGLFKVIIDVNYISPDEDTALITVTVTPLNEFLNDIFTRSVSLQYLRAETSSSGI